MSGSGGGGRAVVEWSMGVDSRWWGGRWGWMRVGGLVVEIRKNVLKIGVEMGFYMSI